MSYIRFVVAFVTLLLLIVNVTTAQTPDSTVSDTILSDTDVPDLEDSREVVYYWACSVEPITKDNINKAGQCIKNGKDTEIGTCVCTLTNTKLQRDVKCAKKYRDTVTIADDEKNCVPPPKPLTLLPLGADADIRCPICETYPKWVCSTQKITNANVAQAEACIEGGEDTKIGECHCGPPITKSRSVACAERGSTGVVIGGTCELPEPDEVIPATEEDCEECGDCDKTKKITRITEVNIQDVKSRNTIVLVGDGKNRTHDIEPKPPKSNDFEILFGVGVGAIVGVDIGPHRGGILAGVGAGVGAVVDGGL